MTGEFLTRLTIWLALCAYATATGMLLLLRANSRRLLHVRWIWTFGCAFFLAHVVCAFSYYHDWSHAAAYRETARQTAEMTGVRWGGGIFFNYLFGMVWLADVLWWWFAPDGFAQRPRWLAAAWHGFFFFMVFNGTIVFGTGPVRWFGVLLCVSLASLWCWSRMGRNRQSL